MGSEQACLLAEYNAWMNGKHHRGQLTTLLSQAGVAYGVTDLFLLPGLLDS